MGREKKTSSIFVVSGASGSGKTTVCRKMADEFDLYYSVSHTTRAKRPQEVDGEDYFFVSLKKFQSMIQNDEFLEWAKVYDNHYGTSRAVIETHLALNQGVILDLDTQGASNIRRYYPEAVLIFLKTPNLDDLKKRLLTRGQDSSAEIKRRVDYAENELAKIGEYDHVILNDDLDRALEATRKIVGAKL